MSSSSSAGGAGQQQPKPKRPPIYQTPPYHALLADPYLESNSQIVPCTILHAASVLHYLLQHCPRLSRYQPHLEEHLIELVKFSSAVDEIGEDVNKFHQFVSVLVERIGSLDVGSVKFVPCGWRGNTGAYSLLLLIERKSIDTYNMIICNAGEGIEYHPSKVMASEVDKIKYQTCFALENIVPERMCDVTFWMTVCTQWFQPSEYHRVEVLYDVLFPWLIGNKKTLSSALLQAKSENGKGGEYRTPMRASTSSGWRNLMEGIRYYLHTHKGHSHQELKYMTTLLKCEMLGLTLEDLNSGLYDMPPTRDECVLIELGCRTVAHASLKLNLEEGEGHMVKNLIDGVKAKLIEVADKKPDNKTEEEKKSNEEKDKMVLFPKPFEGTNLTQIDSTYTNLHLNTENVERYAGLAETPSTSLISDLLQIPITQVTTIDEAVKVLVRLDVVCGELNLRCRDGSSYSSRVSLQYQIGELIGTVMTRVLPLPSSSSSSSSSSDTNTAGNNIWTNFPSKQMLLTTLRLLHTLMCTYASAWQSFDSPTRGYDSERSIVSLCFLTVFDCVIRNDRFDDSIVAQVLRGDDTTGGERSSFCLSTSVCISNRTLYQLSSTMELHTPSFCQARSQCLSYFETLQQSCQHKDLFIFRMPTDKIEIKKYGTTIHFLRQIMERAGYELISSEINNPPPEMELLMDWLTSPGTALARNQPEFGMLRDVCCLYKFMATMESRQSELQRQRITPSTYVSWGLSFEDTSMQSSTFGGSGMRMRHYNSANVLRWEVLNYRGLDLDTADVQVTAFGERKIYFGQSSVVFSPVDTTTLISSTAGNTLPTEDDILHATSLPNYGDTLSRQESEMLLSYLTVPYLRIPLVLNFFATGDRVTYLFNVELQSLLRAAIFDCGDWIPECYEDRIETVPVRGGIGYKSSLNEIIGGSPGPSSNHARKEKNTVLGTPHGLLLNELRHSPQSTLRPLLKMMKSINDLAEASVYSPNAALSLYLIELALDVQSFFPSLDIENSTTMKEYMKELSDYLTTSCHTILHRWLTEAMSNDDIETSCLIHSYLALLYTNLPPQNFTIDIITDVLGSICFVRNWHGFGLGEPTNSSGIGSTSSVDSTATPEQRLLRFLQAYGIDIDKIAKGSLRKYVSQSNKTLYLRVGSRTVRVPNLGGTTDDGDEKGVKRSQLMVSVPEQKLFAMVQSKRYDLVSFLEGLRSSSPGLLSKCLDKVVSIALDSKGTTTAKDDEDDDATEEEVNPDNEQQQWTHTSRGKYQSPNTEITIDIQSCQILWRNDELKPMPDSMTQFNDYHTIFGTKQLHCGVVAYQQRRQWVHVVDTPFDLMLWDEVEDDDQGVGCPKEITAVASASATDGEGEGVEVELFWQCSMCTYRNSSSSNSSSGGGVGVGMPEMCQMCGAPKSSPTPAPSANNNTQMTTDNNEDDDPASKSPTIIEYQNVRYDRPLNPFDEDNLNSFTDENEHWAIQLLVDGIKSHYLDQMPFKLLLPSEPIGGDCNVVSAMAGVKTETEIEPKPSAQRRTGFGGGGGMFSSSSYQPPPTKVTTTTYKLFLLYKQRSLLHVYNIQSHGRKMYHQLIYSSSSTSSLHSLPPSKTVFNACGDLKIVVSPEPSLVITRTNNDIIGKEEIIETFVPSRLLFGVIPTALLETYRFWYGSDGIVRGEALDVESTWFGGSTGIEIGKDCTIYQVPISQQMKKGKKKRGGGGAGGGKRRRLVVKSTPDDDDDDDVEMTPASATQQQQQEFDPNVVMDLCAIGFTPPQAKLALSKCNNNSAFAAEWLLNPQNATAIDRVEDMVLEHNRLYKVVHHGSVYVRDAPKDSEEDDDERMFFGRDDRVLRYGQEVKVVERMGNWVRILDEDKSKRAGVGGVGGGGGNKKEERWVLAYHSKHGTILEPVSDSDSSGAKAESEKDAKVVAPAAFAAAATEAATKAQKKAQQGDGDAMDIDTNNEGNEKPLPPTTTSTKRKLINLLDQPIQTDDIYHLLSTLQQIEDLSHILAWADVTTNTITSIELPRLKLRIEPRPNTDDNGKKVTNHLHLTDQSGWYICTISEPYKSLLNCHSLLLQNHMKEIQFLVPNHVLSRPSLKGQPFSTKLLCHRGSESWMQTMDTRYYLYKVHTSATFLVSQELSASIYLTNIALLQRNYQECFQLAPTCTVDVPFTPEESFLWGMLQQSLDDRHPDAHACRLKLTLAIMYALERITIPWEVHVEYDGYLRKLNRVSSCCRLSKVEEMKLCKLVKSATPLIKNRLVLLTNTSDTVPVELKAPSSRVGGSPWNKIQTQSLQYYNNHGTTIKRIHFRPQLGTNTFDYYMSDLIYNNTIVCDEESGVNRQLGYAFLYQLLTARSESTTEVPLGSVKPKSMGEISTMYLHLKLSRWGRERVEEGEVETSNSRQMAQLVSILSRPDIGWPKMPNDEDSMRLLNNGINLYTDTGRHSSVKGWLDRVDEEFVRIWPNIVEANNSGGASLRSIPPFVLREIVRPRRFHIQPAVIIDTGLEVRKAPSNEIGTMMSWPLGQLCQSFLTTRTKDVSDVHDTLPFNLHSHKAARTDVAREILVRLEEDVKGYAISQRDTTEHVLLSTSTSTLQDLLNQLESLRIDDATQVRNSIQTLQTSASTLTSDPQCTLSLQTHGHHREDVTFSLLTQALMSRTAVADLQKINPTLEEGQVEQMLDEVTEMLVRISRISHVSRTVTLVKELINELTRCSASNGGDDKSSGRSNNLRVNQLSKSLATSLATKRHYISDDNTFDPRFLVFEYVFDILLRQRQVEIVNSFVADLRNNTSHVQQMIMGAGKTTVVAPLLTLLLADGNALVTQVMPTPLLEQTRHIMRTRFYSAILSKRVYTLEFDRSVEDDINVILSIYNKLNDARLSGSVICASPDAIKSLFLKFVEHNHSLQSMDADIILRPTESLRQNREIMELRDIMERRSDMADCIIPILDMWSNGVLIMDEVDVLLHPLRSELNFPIGLKDPIDLSGYRWDLPLFILSAFFKETLVKETTDVTKQKVLEEIGKVVESGYTSHSLQRNPHLVLLDDMYYKSKLMHLAARWASIWLMEHSHDLTNNHQEEDIVTYLTIDDLNCTTCPHANRIRTIFTPLGGSTSMKLLNLTRDWIRILLPHTLSKIDRVSFGILSPIDLLNAVTHQKAAQQMPLSRKLMAVPFVGKDVPSRSSEFAHPDVVIGLTVLGYRYEGLRLSDVRTIVTQLKSDFGRQVGPRDTRPACVLFRGWVNEATQDLNEDEEDQLPVLPLPLFQVNDPKQLNRLYQLLQKQSSVITYYLRQHVFPSCMNFQSTKVSACGHELGSSMLFTKRIGFSGTPSNLIPKDLGQCLYEPGSDGKVVHVLSSKEVVTLERKEIWTAKSLLRDVASTATERYHALIDTGALITGMDNEQVAHYLLQHLPTQTFDGVVYLDRSDRKMFLQRSSGKSLHLSQCGVDPSRRFTFYDQVHTTGMDIKQCDDAKAVVTIGKDMTFRDYAQGSFRMRGIGAGQTIHLYLIAEVEQLIKNELYSIDDPRRSKPCSPLDVPAWLLINSMKMETIQHSMLSYQELYNCWRKVALHGLVQDCKMNSPHIPGVTNPKTSTERMRRYVDAPSEWLYKCITLFREPVGFVIPNEIPSPQPFHDKVLKLIHENQHFHIQSTETTTLVNSIADSVRYTKDILNDEDNLESEIVNENEQEQQQQQEEEAEEEQEKVSRYTRDDEQANPWAITHLNKEPTCIPGEEPFYRMSTFTVRPTQPKLTFPSNLLLSDNWFRPRWIGLGDRRLKNVLIVMEWTPKSFGTKLLNLIPALHSRLMVEHKLGANAAAVRAIAVATSPVTPEDFALRKCLSDGLAKNAAASEEKKCYAAISLAEAETLRRVLHTKQAVLTSDFGLLSIEDGSCIDATTTTLSQTSSSDPKANLTAQTDKDLAISCFRFVNGDMHYTPNELSVLQKVFYLSSITDRIHFFEDCLRLRKREKYVWGDTPLAKLFTEECDWHLLDTRAKLQQMSQSMIRILKSKSNTIDLLSNFTKVDVDNDNSLTYAELQRLLEDMRIGFSPADIASVIRLIDTEKIGKISWDTFVQAFVLPPDLLSIDKNDTSTTMMETEKTRWICTNCTYAYNDSNSVTCEICNYGWDGQLHVPSDKWMCDPNFGGCSYFNTNDTYYCSVCDRSKPSLHNQRF